MGGKGVEIRRGGKRYEVMQLRKKGEVQGDTNEEEVGDDKMKKR